MNRSSCHSSIQSGNADLAYSPRSGSRILDNGVEPRLGMTRLPGRRAGVQRN